LILDADAVTGIAIDARGSPRRPGDPSILVAEATRARELFGWSAERSDLSSIIQDAWRWHGHRFRGARELTNTPEASRLP
jgi:UDP-glucose 4-epimerase